MDIHDYKSIVVRIDDELEVELEALYLVAMVKHR